MLAKTHITGGAVAATLYALAAVSMDSLPEASLGILGTTIAAGGFGGLIPDIDHPNSKISKKLKPISKIVNLIFSHRGLFHTPILYIIIWGLLTFQIANPYYGFLLNAIFIGIASHLILDALNPTGIPLFFPLENKRRHFANIKTGSWAETLVFGTLFVCLTMLCLVLFKVFLH